MSKCNSRILLNLGLIAGLAANVHSATLEGLPGTLFSPSAQSLGHLSISGSVGAYGHQDGSMVKDHLFLFHHTGFAGDADTAQIQDFQSGTVRLNLAIGLGRFFDLGLTVPYSADYIGDTKAKKLSGNGLGDPILSAKGGVSLANNHILDAALLCAITLPSKSNSGFLPKQPGYVSTDSAVGAPYFFSSYGVGGSIQSVWTLDLTRIEAQLPFRGNLNAGISHSGASGAPAEVLFGGGLEWLPLPSLQLFVDMQSETRAGLAGKFSKVGKDFSFLAAGFTATGEDGVFFSVGLQKSLAKRPFHAYSKDLADGRMTYSSRYQPDFAVAFNLGWSGDLISVDTDKDGIPDKEDLCITEAEDQDTFQDQDGCPEYDNDGDSIYDAKDKCPLEPEDVDGFQDDDGCPDPDNDKDGVPDLSDKCPNEAEDLDGFEDFDGCPELDNDKDGVPDAQDKCANLVEDQDGFEDADGCPDPDNDKDKIPDLNDKCPNEPETINGFEDGDGCPDQVHGSSGEVLPPLPRRSLLKMVSFRGNTAELLPVSNLSLDTLSAQIKGAPGSLVEIRGYMDDSGNELVRMRLSEARAKAVRSYLISNGALPSQVLARGMGARDPIASNHTATGRIQNRRIEMHRLD